MKYAAGCESSDVSETVKLVCDPLTKIVVLKADFGRDKYSMACDDKYYSGTCTSRDESVKDLIKNLCGGKENCDLTANVNTFPDPCPYVIKLLRVWYQCVGEGISLIKKLNLYILLK